MPVGFFRVPDRARMGCEDTVSIGPAPPVLHPDATGDTSRNREDQTPVMSVILEWPVKNRGALAEQSSGPEATSVPDSHCCFGRYISDTTCWRFSDPAHYGYR